MGRPSNLDQFPGMIGTFMGRDALTLAGLYLNLSSEDTIMLPVYTCQEVLKSYVDRLKVVFYDVRPDLSIDPDELRQKMLGRQVKAILITNYFGFLQPNRDALKSLAAEGGVRLIEDCAHSLLTKDSGGTGDFSTYSFRKILPVSDGGGLSVKDVGSRVFDPDFHPRMFSDVLSAISTFKSLLRIRTPRFSRASIVSHAGKILPRTSNPVASSKLLPLSHFCESRMSDISFSEIIKKRREDFQFWQDIAAKVEWLRPVFKKLLPDVCPSGFPVKLNHRESFEDRARGMGVPLSVHWRLEPTLGAECQTSHRLSKEMLTLPLYPDVSEKKRDALASLVTRGWMPS
jgi:DegT/DnrJ/EryC1/StrS aminotransferase family